MSGKALANAAYSEHPGHTSGKATTGAADRTPLTYFWDSYSGCRRRTSPKVLNVPADRRQNGPSGHQRRTSGKGLAAAGDRLPQTYSRKGLRCCSIRTSGMAPADAVDRTPQTYAHHGPSVRHRRMSAVAPPKALEVAAHRLPQTYARNGLRGRSIPAYDDIRLQLTLQTYAHHGPSVRHKRMSAVALA
ncbi:hypothetical protein M422DRAFT_247281 [Sphaerobolus stellatus SS14]|nr:hypothetical protein M422DRAFT_247281 [Sphaerobolus stellatus SS14]